MAKRLIYWKMTTKRLYWKNFYDKRQFSRYLDKQLWEISGVATKSTDFKAMV